jgi:uncharacterized protein YegP (UPF0339 family)
MARFQTFQDKADKWRWRLVDGNNRKVATSGESFDSRSNALRAARNVKATAPSALLPVRLRAPARPAPSLLSDILDAASQARR